MKNVVARLIELAGELRAAAQPRRRPARRRRARGVQARLRQPHAHLADLGDRLRPGPLRRALRRPRRRRLLPRLPRPRLAAIAAGEGRGVAAGPLPRLRGLQRAEHRARRRRPVQGVEVDPRRARDQELRALLRRVGDAELELALRVVPAASKAASSGAGIEASQSSQIRFVWAKLPTGITPAMIGTSIPIARAAATKSK